MNTVMILLVCLLAAVIGAIVFIAALPSLERGSDPAAESISVETQGSIVTVRRAGRVTSVSITGGPLDHWEGGAVTLEPLGPEATRLYEPELYSEYMSPSTSAIRKYEIIEDVYAKGFTLPYIKGLHEKYLQEKAEAMKDPNGRAATEPTPVNLSKGKGKEQKLDINRELGKTRFESVEEPSPSENENK